MSKDSDLQPTPSAETSGSYPRDDEKVAFLVTNDNQPATSYSVYNTARDEQADSYGEYSSWSLTLGYLYEVLS